MLARRTLTLRSPSPAFAGFALFPLLALLAAPLEAESLVKKGGEFQVNSATDQASQADVALGSPGDMAIAFQNDLVDTWLVRMTEAGDGTLSVVSEQLVASGSFTQPQVLPVQSTGAVAATPPPGSGVGYVVLRTAEEMIQTVFPDDPISPPQDLVETIYNSAAMSFAYLGGGFSTSSRIGDTFYYHRYTWGGADNQEPLSTAYGVNHPVLAFHQQAVSVSLRPSSGQTGPLAGRAQRTPPPEPGLLLAELAHDDFGGSFIQGRLFDDMANPVGGPFLVNPSAFDGFKVTVKVAATPSGTAMVVWEDLTYGRQPVFALVDWQGPIPGAAGFVSNTGFIEQSSPRVAVIGEHFIVTWRRRGVNSDPDTIHARSIDASNPSAPLLGPVVEVSGPAAAGGRSEPAIAADEAGNVVIVWTETSPDLLSSDVVGQRLRLEDPIFIDGFESGDTGGWSALSP